MSESLLNTSTPPVDDNTPPPTDAPITPPTGVSIPENWKEILDEDFRNDPSLQPINTLQDLAKSYINAQKMVGADKVQLPNKYDDGTQLRNVLTKLGLPTNLDEYDIKPKEIEIENEELFNQFKAQAHKLGILPNQAKEIFQFLHNQSVEQDNQLVEQMKKQEEEAVQSLQKEWGAAFKNKVQLAQSAVKHISGEDETLYNMLISPQFGNNPAIVKAFARVGEMLSEDKIINGIAKDDMAKSPAEAQKEIETIYGDKTHPYNMPEHPRHAAAVKEMQELFKLTSL